MTARNYKELHKDIETYGIDESTDRAIRDIQTLRTDKERVRRFISTLKQEGARTYNRENSQTDGQQQLDTSNRTGINGDSLANFESEGLALFSTPQGEVYGFVTKDGKIYLDETIISPNHAIHEYSHLWDRAVQRS